MNDMRNYWITQKGERIKYKDLKDDHLINILRWIEVRAENGMSFIDGEVNGIHDSWAIEYHIKGDEVLSKYDYKGLIDEANKRGLNINTSNYEK